MAKTEIFQRIEDWRVANGRDPKTGSKGRTCGKQRPTFTDAGLLILALRMASEYGREDLRPEYKRLEQECLEALGEQY